MPTEKKPTTGLVICRRAATAPSLASAGFGFPGAYQSRAKSFMAEKRFRRFQQVVAGLRKHCPAAFPVIVRTKRLAPGTEGTCVRTKNRFVISISETATEKNGIEVLLHEWGHSLSWSHITDAFMKMPLDDEGVFERLSHGPDWGVAYSRVWRCFVTRILPELD